MNEEIINKNYIDEFVSIAGTEPLVEAIIMFGSSVLEYIKNCQALFNQGHYDEAAKEVHKIKGAASSIGLNRMMIEAKKFELDLIAQEKAFPLAERLEVLQHLASDDAHELLTYVKKQ